MKRGFAHIEIIIVILLIAVFGVVVFMVSKNSGTPLVSQSSPTPEAIMEEDEGYYENKDYNFRLKLPSDWEVRKNATGYVENDSEVEENLQIAPTDFKGGFFGSVEIRTDDIDSAIAKIQKTTDDYNDYLMELGGKNISKFILRQDSNYNGLEAVVLTYSDQTSGSNSEYIIFSHEKLTYVLYRSTDDSNPKYEIASQILSTFRFDSGL